MIKKFLTWRRSLSPLKQLLVVGLLFWVYWFAVSFLTSRIFGSGHETLTYRVCNALWMALVFTAVFHWKVVKAAFGRGRKSENA